jgi:hypothetical protein
VGVDHDTCVFAVASIRRWWQARGRWDYPKASRLLITADAGGSNGYRHRVWKSELAALAAETGCRSRCATSRRAPPRRSYRCQAAAVAVSWPVWLSTANTSRAT